jgi:hypothetical protein
MTEEQSREEEGGVERRVEGSHLRLWSSSSSLLLDLSCSPCCQVRVRARERGRERGMTIDPMRQNDLAATLLRYSINYITQNRIMPHQFLQFCIARCTARARIAP